MLVKLIYIISLFILFLGINCKCEEYKKTDSDKLYDLIKREYVQGNLDSVITLTKIFLEKPDSSQQYKTRQLRLYNLLGAIYYTKFDFDKAESYYDTALKLSNNSEFKSVIFGNMANIYLSQGDLIKAITYYNRAIAGIDTTDYVTLSNNYSNLGIAYYKSGHWEKSIKVTLKSIAITEKYHLNDIGDKSNTCAIAYQELGNFQKAELFFKKAIQANTKEYGALHYRTAIVMQSYAYLLFSNKKFNKSYHLLKQAYNILLKSFNFKNPYISDCLQKFGEYYEAKGEPDRALQYFQKALITRIQNFNDTSIYSNPGKNIFSNPALIDILRSKSIELEKIALKRDKQKNLVAALATVQLAENYIEKLRTGYLFEESKLWLTSKVADIYKSGVRIASELYQLTGRKKFLYDAFEFSEKDKYGVLRELRNDENAWNIAGIPDSISNEDLRLARDLASTRVLIEKENRNEKPDRNILHSLNNRLFDLTRKQEKFITKLGKEYPLYYRMKYENKVVDPQYLQDYLTPNRALIEYSLMDTAVYIFIATPDTFALVIQSTDTSFYNSLDEYTKFMYSSYSMLYPPWRKASYNLYRYLIQPVQSLLKNKEVVIVPDGKLSLISFEPFTTKPYKENTWHMFQNEPYLLYKYSISYSYTASLLVNSTDKHFPFWKSFIGFAPDYTNSPDSLENVPEGEKSMKMIARLFLGRAITGKKATESCFKRDNDYNIITLYAHGEDDTLQPSLSQVAFSPDTSGGEDSYLHAGEIGDMRIRSNLVVLVSCYSGSGKISHGEGVLSVGRSFMNAGAPAMVMSIWSAGSAPSFAIIKKFFIGLLKGEDKAFALRNAKIEYLKTSNTVTADPKNWSGLVLVGNSDPLFNHYLMKIIILPVALLVLITLLVLLRKKLFKFF